MPQPQTKEEWEAAGYVFDNEAKCRFCGALIEWWISPNDKKMPMSVIEKKDETKTFPQPIIGIIRRPHFADCKQYPGRK